MIKDGVMIYCEECSSYDCGCPEAKEIKSLRQQLASCDAEIERLKTVPMRYRRMAFNAQLQDENTQLCQQLA